MKKFSIFNFQFSILFTLFLSFLSSPKAFAQFTDYLGRARGANLDVQTLLRMIGGLACWFLRFGIIAVGVMMVIFGILFIASRGNAQSFSDARRALTWGIVGGLAIFGVFTIILSVPAILSALGLVGGNYPILLIVSC